MLALLASALICVPSVAQKRNAPPPAKPPAQQGGAAATPHNPPANQPEHNSATPNNANVNANQLAPRGGQQVRPQVGEWLQRYKDMPPDQQEKQLMNDPLYRRLPVERQQQLMQRLHNFNNLPPNQRDMLVDRMRKFESLTPEQQHQLRQLNENLQQLPGQRQGAVRDALRRMNSMGPEERERIFNSPRFQSMFNPNEIGIIRGLSGISVPANQSRPPQTSPAGGPPFEPPPFFEF